MVNIPKLTMAGMAELAVYLNGGLGRGAELLLDGVDDVF